MSDESPSDVLGSLPRARPHRRSQKRSRTPAGAPNGNPPPAQGTRSAAAGEPQSSPRPAPKPKRTARRKPEPQSSPPPGPETEPQAAPLPSPAAPPRSTAKPEPPKEHASEQDGQSVELGEPPEEGDWTVQGEPTGTAGRAAEAANKAARLRQPTQPAGLPPSSGTRKPVPASGSEILATAVQATAELAEIGLTMSARALRSAVSRLPKP